MAGPLPATSADPARHDRAVVALADGAVRDAPPPCAACGALAARPRFAIEDLAARLVVCTDCGTGRLHPLPEEEEIARFYPATYYGEGGAKFRRPVEWLVRAVGARHARFLAAGLAPGARVLDVGCGRGVTLAALAERGFEAHGVERSADAARGADARARVRIAPSLADASYPAGHFDAVVVWHVFEHLREPDVALAEMRRVLRPGGRLVVAVPNFASWQARWAGPAWFHLDPPRHLHHFPLAALRRLLERSGFAVESEHHFSLRQNPFGWIQSAQNRLCSRPRNGLYTLLHQGGAGYAAPFDPRTRALLWAVLALGAAPSLALACAEAAGRSGATVHVAARACG
jgi:SAM-dependent methyltransferase